MVVGLATVIESFQGIIGGLTRDFEVYYVETREKSSSRLLGKVKFDMETVAFDILSVLRFLELPFKKYILFGYSYSAAVIVEAPGLRQSPGIRPSRPTPTRPAARYGHRRSKFLRRDGHLWPGADR